MDDVQFFSQQAQSHVDALTDLVNKSLLHDGDIEETSQRICFLNAINKVEMCINGVSEADLNSPLQL